MDWYGGGAIDFFSAIEHRPGNIATSLPDFPLLAGVAPTCLSNRALRHLGLGSSEHVPLKLGDALVEWSFVRLPHGDSFLDRDRTVLSKSGRVKQPVFSSFEPGTMCKLSNSWLHGSLTYYVHSETWADMCRLGFTGLVETHRQSLPAESS